MDPLTATMNAIAQGLTLANKVWDAMPPELKTASAKDWATMVHNSAQFILDIQDKINAASKIQP